MEHSFLYALGFFHLALHPVSQQRSCSAPHAPQALSTPSEQAACQMLAAQQSHGASHREHHL